jgi:hypothetical protein
MIEDRYSRVGAIGCCESISKWRSKVTGPMRDYELESGRNEVAFHIGREPVAARRAVEVENARTGSFDEVLDWAA